jgi:ribonuclease HI
MKTVTLTTDGAADPNAGRGGWAFIARYPSPSQPMEQSGEGLHGDL